MSRWYASKAAARRPHAFPILADVVPAGRNVLLCLWRYDDRYHGTVLVWRTDVTGRSARHIDRLARDWIGHGVAPCLDGSRGVRDPRRPAKKRGRGFIEVPGRLRTGWWIADSFALATYLRAEARARRVVRR